MSEADPVRLLHRDQAELDRVAMLMRDGRTVAAFIVCRPSLRPAVLEHLRAQRPGREIPAPVTPSDGRALLDLLLEAVKQPPEVVVSVALPREASPLHDTLNLHREKLRKGASKLMFIDGAEGMNTLRAIGPDAYTFRDVMAFLVGEPPPMPVVPDEEPDQVRFARDRYRRARREKAFAAAMLGGNLRSLRRFGESERVVRATLDDVSGLDRDMDSELVPRLLLWGELASVASERGAHASSLLYVTRGLVEAKSGGAGGREFWLECISMGPYGRDGRAARSVIEKRALGLVDEATLGEALLARASWCVDMGKIQAAAEALDERSLVPGVQGRNRVIGLVARAEVDIASGRLDACEANSREAVQALLEVGASTASAQYVLAKSLHRRGEGDAARRVMEAAASSEGAERMRSYLAEMSIASGNVEHGFDALRAVLNEAAARGADWHHYTAGFALLESLTAAHAAARLSPNDLPRADTDLEVAEDVSLAMVGTDPPWYTILFPLLRSDLFALRADHLPDALRLSALALERARASCPELTPKAARTHGHNLLLAGRLPEALETLSLAESASRQEENLRELAHSQRLSLVALLRAGLTSDLAARLADLRKTLESTGSPRITAENLLDLARDLPPETTSPDPLALAEEALTLFRDMPIPEKEALCHETAGDILLARGRPEDARRRYLTARRRLERHNLGLRLPLLQSKIDRIPPPV